MGDTNLSIVAIARSELVVNFGTITIIEIN